MSAKQKTGKGPPSAPSGPGASPSEKGNSDSQTSKARRDETDVAEKSPSAVQGAKSDRGPARSQQHSTVTTLGFTLRQYIDERTEDEPWQPGKKRKASDDQGQVCPRAATSAALTFSPFKADERKGPRKRRDEVLASILAQATSVSSAKASKTA